MPQVMVVEDDPAQRRLLQKELENNGYTVSVAENGLDALMKLESGRPDVIVCDLEMPQLDGISFTQAIRGNDQTRAIPVIFLTSNADSRKMIDGINAGARFYLLKPVDMKDLFAKLKKVAGDDRGRRTS
jgi:CheY-like chemotaxis protein